MRNLLIAMASAGLFATTFAPAQAAPLPVQPSADRMVGNADSLLQDVQYRRIYRTDRFGRPVVVDRYDGRRGYYGPRSRYGYHGRPYRRVDPGAAAAAGIVGLATGAIIGGAIANQGAPARVQTVDPNYIQYCSQKYRSFDPASGTYLGYDGQRHRCVID